MRRDSSAPAIALLLLAVAVLPGGLGCAADQSSPLTAVVVAWDPVAGAYKLAQVRVNTLTSLRHLQGSAGVVRAGGAVRVQTSVLLSARSTVDALRGQFITAPPSDVELSFTNANGFVYPGNYTSLELLTAYANIERARTDFAGWGLTNLAPALVVAHADISNEQGLDPVGDGELFYAPLGNWYLPAPGARQQLPPHFNLGDVAHGLAHQAVAQVVWAGAPLPPIEQGQSSDPATLTARHVARSMVEGLGDYLGAAESQDPRWFDHSVQQSAAARALDEVRCSSTAMLDALAVPDSASSSYDPYPLGTVLAGALYEAATAPTGGTQVISKGVMLSLSRLATVQANNGGKLSVGDVLEALVSSSDPTQLPVLCGLFPERFKKLSVTATALPSCNGVAAQVPAESCN